LLSGQEDDDITDWFIGSAFPTPQEVEDVLNALEAEPKGLSVPELLTQVNVSKGRVEKTLQLLSLELPAPIAKLGTKWQLTAATLNKGFWERAERITSLRREEQQQMREYVALAYGDHMRFLVEALDGDPSTISPPSLHPLPADLDATLVREAVAFLRRTDLPIEPRKKWPDGGMPLYKVKGSIVGAYQAQSGRALCVWGDAGWGGLVREGKYQDGHFDDDLITACVEMIQRWNPQPAPTWITCIPSLRHPDLVPNFAQRLAVALSLPFHMALAKTDARSQQKTMANSTQQARNVDGSLAVVRQPLPHGPVFLVDDMVDSRWTLAVAAWLLRTNGSGEVRPITLSQTGHDQ
jgi:ATP-dependent DNA helicase RecQ